MIRDLCYIYPDLAIVCFLGHMGTGGARLLWVTILGIPSWDGHFGHRFSGCALLLRFA